MKQALVSVPWLSFGVQLSWIKSNTIYRPVVSCSIFQGDSLENERTFGEINIEIVGRSFGRKRISTEFLNYSGAIPATIPVHGGSQKLIMIIPTLVKCPRTVSSAVSECSWLGGKSSFDSEANHLKNWRMHNSSLPESNRLQSCFLFMNFNQLWPTWNVPDRYLLSNNPIFFIMNNSICWNLKTMSLKFIQCGDLYALSGINFI